MFKNLVSKVVGKIDLSVLLKTATNVANQSYDVDAIAKFTRNAAYDAVKSFLFKYVIIMNFVVGLIMFLIGIVVGKMI